MPGELQLIYALSVYSAEGAKIIQFPAKSPAYSPLLRTEPNLTLPNCRNSAGAQLALRPPRAARRLGAITGRIFTASAAAPLCPPGHFFRHEIWSAAAPPAARAGGYWRVNSNAQTYRGTFPRIGWVCVGGEGGGQISTLKHIRGH